MIQNTVETGPSQKFYAFHLHVDGAFDIALRCLPVVRNSYIKLLECVSCLPGEVTKLLCHRVLSVSGPPRTGIRSRVRPLLMALESRTYISPAPARQITAPVNAIIGSGFGSPIIRIHALFVRLLENNGLGASTRQALHEGGPPAGLESLSIIGSACVHVGINRVAVLPSSISSTRSSTYICCGPGYHDFESLPIAHRFPVSILIPKNCYDVPHVFDTLACNQFLHADYKSASEGDLQTSVYPGAMEIRY